MENLQTTIVGCLKALAGIAYAVYKLRATGTLTLEDMAIVGLALGGTAGNLLSADAKPKAQ